MKKIILISTVLGAGAIALGTFGAIASTAPCNYNEKGQWVSNGQVHAWGPMEGAWLCAATGSLPQPVIDRLGRWGSKDEAAAIRRLDAAEKAKAIEEQK